jgi:hypothetical protein
MFNWISTALPGWSHSEVYKNVLANITVGLVVRRNDQAPYSAQYFSGDVHLNWTGADLGKAHAFIEDQAEFTERCELAGVST